MDSESPSARWNTFPIVRTSRELGRSTDCPAFCEAYRRRERIDAEDTERPSSESNPWPTAVELLEIVSQGAEISEEEYRERKRLLIEEDLRRRAQL
jgi:hypothetical protein